jgi:hypothetical protein
VATFEIGGVDRPLTPDERTFIAGVLRDKPPFLDVWRHVDEDGSPWLIISADFIVDGAVRGTLRLDFDGASMKGGWSRFLLNGDDGLRAELAGVDFNGADGYSKAFEDVAEASLDVRHWFEHHYEAWQSDHRPHGRDD